MPSRDDVHRRANINNPFDDAPQRISEYTAKEVATLQSRLDKQLGPEFISKRQGPGGSSVHYIAGDTAINLANDVFGFNGWSTEIRQVQIDFVDENTSTGRISLGLSIIVRVTLKDGTFHEDIGYGQIENSKGKAAAFNKAKKEAVTDGLKRALRNFGNVVGNCVYDKEYVKKITRVKAPPAKFDLDNLHRHPSHREPGSGKAASSDSVSDEAKKARSESERSKGTNVEFEDDFENAFFEGIDFDSGDPDGVVIDNTADASDMRTAEPPRTAQNSMTRQSAQRVNSAPVLRPPGAAPGPASPQKPAQPTAQVSRPAGAQMNMQQAQNGAGPGPRLNPQGPNAIGAPAGPLDSRQIPGAAQGPAAVPGTVGGERVGFVTGRAAEMVQNQGVAQNPLPLNAPAFNPHQESPSLRRTNGVDHKKSMPINRSTLAPGAPAANTIAQPPGADQRPPTRGSIVNPQADSNRRIGMPAAAQSPLANRGGYRPPTMQKRPADGGAPRSALADVSNLQLDGTGGNNIDAKKQKVDG